MAMAVRREKSAAMPPEPGPDFLPVGLRQIQTVERAAGEELKTSFGVVGRQCFQTRLYFKQKHKPVRPALEAVFADEAGQVQIFGAQRQAGFFVRLAAGAGVGRFAAVHFQFPTTGTPQTAVRLLRAFEQKHLLALVEAIQQRGDFVGQNHQTEFQISSAECRGRNERTSAPPPFFPPLGALASTLRSAATEDGSRRLAALRQTVSNPPTRRRRSQESQSGSVRIS